MKQNEDLISRTAAVNRILATGYADQIKDNLLLILRLLPPAQPEFTRCKDCKHYWIHKCMDSMPIERCDLGQTFYAAEHDFCSLAERREDG